MATPAKPPPFLEANPWRRAPSYAGKIEVPPAEDLAMLLRSGVTIEELATEFDRSPNTLRQKIYNAGWSSVTGQPTGRDDDTVDMVGLARIFEIPAWMDDANCLGTDPEAFFPGKEKDGGNNGTSRAKKVCRRCPVAAECLDYALENRDRYGVWGGLSEPQRSKLLTALGVADDIEDAS